MITQATTELVRRSRSLSMMGECFKIQQQTERERVLQNPATEREREWFKIQQQMLGERIASRGRVGRRTAAALLSLSYIHTYVLTDVHAETTREIKEGSSVE